jgi:hypothetical protein
VNSLVVLHFVILFRIALLGAVTDRSLLEIDFDFLIVYDFCGITRQNTVDVIGLIQGKTFGALLFGRRFIQDLLAHRVNIETE